MLARLASLRIVVTAAVVVVVPQQAEAGGDSGMPCTQDKQCAVACVDGVCCDTFCDEPCFACSAALKAEGPDGVCGFLDELPGAPETACAGPSVAVSFKCSAPLAPNPFYKACAPFRCVDGVCLTHCATSDDCAPGYFCGLGQCDPKLPNGAPCDAGPTSCVSGVCADGLCCNQACEAQCAACDTPYGPGTCAPVEGAPHADREPCPTIDSAEPVCGAQQCDGIDPSRCAAIPGAEQPCGAEPGCTDGVATLPSSCDGSGACTPPETRECAPYACAVDACRTSCVTDAYCAAGYQCDGTRGECVEAAGFCLDDRSLIGVDGSRADCTPYVCREAACLERCNGNLDCVEGSSCSSDRTCSELPADDGATTGCGPGCAVGRSRSGFTALLVIVGGVLVSNARRRSRATPGRPAPSRHRCRAE